MADTAMTTTKNRETGRSPKQDPWTGVGLTLAETIWRFGYGATAPSHRPPMIGAAGSSAEPIAGHRMVFLIGASHTTASGWSSGVEELYPVAFKPTTAETGLMVSVGGYTISGPVRPTSRPPDAVLWALEGSEPYKILLIDEAHLTSTDPEDPYHVSTLPQMLESGQTLGDTPPEPEPTANARDPHAELRMLAQATRLPVERLGELLGASRRTVYNWLAGRPIRDEAQSRIFRLRDALDPIVSTRDPVLIRDWLVRGEPSPAGLAAAGRWDELDARVRQETAPLQSSDERPDEEGGQLQAETPDVLRAALLAFSAAPERRATRRPAWKPHELTGITSEDEEDPA